MRSNSSCVPARRSGRAPSDDDQVGVPNRRQPVGDDEGRPARQSSEPQRALDLALGADVDRGRGLVEDQDPGIGEQRARERDELPLAERESRDPRSCSCVS